MPHKARSKEQLLDLLLLGLTWVNADSPSSHNGWTYNGIFQTIRLVGAISEDQYKHVASGSDDKLNQYLMDNAALAFPQSQRPIGPVIAGRPLRTALPSQSTCTRLVGSDKLLVILVNQPLFDKRAIVTPWGFPLLPTARGRERAYSLAAKYASELPEDSFRSQWRLHTRAMRGMYASGSADG